ncbi:MAG: radical SAM protein [Bacteroidetes bacterium]|nr:radical SAM protein [Bacteroidota bacterium]
MSNKHYLTGSSKFFLYLKIAAHVACKYISLARNPAIYVRFLRRALLLMKIFYPHKAVKVANGYKLHLYLPAYPSKAFFYTLESKLIKTPPGPTTLVFSMTKVCTYKCPHCYQRRDGGRDLPEDILLKTVRNLQDAGVALFNIEGGDPFLRFDRLRGILQELDDRSEIWVNTTGAGVDKEKLSVLKEVGLAGLMVSLHSPYPDVHDKFTGVTNSYDVACKTVRLCRELGLSAVCNSVLMEKDIKEGQLDMLMKTARDLDVDYIQLIHPKPSGMWLENVNLMQSDAPLIEWVRQEHARYNSRRMSDYPALAAQAAEETPESLGCTAGGVDRFYVNAAGEMQPCEFLNISFGNIKDEPFDVVLERMRSYFRFPCVDWICCTQAGAVAELMKKHSLTKTPIPWQYTRELVETWDRGEKTRFYRNIGIYK